MDSESDIDLSWIQDQENIQQFHNGVLKESMNNVSVFMLYMNKNKYIEKIFRQSYPLDPVSKGSILSKENILRIIQFHKFRTPVSKYKFQEILQFNLSIESDYVHSFATTDVSGEGLQVISVVEDVFFPESLLMFHRINSLFFVFREVDLHSRRHTLKSILKTVENDDGQSKKVRVVDRSRTTRKMYSDEIM
jgi:hypothetical protein